MNLRAVDLNLLVILDALLDEAHVSRAANRLNLSQPATSASLARLRQLFGDPLLERAEGAMRLTPVAEALRGRLKDLLADTHALLDLQPEALRTVQKVVRIATADHLAIRIADQLHRLLSETAPGIDLVFQPYHGAVGALEALGKGAIDLSISILPTAAPPITREEFMRERWRVIMRKDHPAATNFDLDQWLAFPHINVSGRGEVRAALDDKIAALGRTRRIALVVPSFLMVAPLVQRSDFLSVIPTLSLPLASIEDFAIFKPPIVLEEFPIHIAWHARHDVDVAVQHVRSTIQGLQLGEL
ncbi:LysR family transcriptional regulator [Novosphingobium lentum]|uniref:LysR family transcriptional regulator n=1 Tax=Novosphingobium lentum TaxID=145287 RepID=UPI000835BA8F|nr:LysR family transcriptional regulator [Novosphingobium lentum]